MFRIQPISSGSKGNVIYVETNSAKLLVDVGLSAKAVEERLHSVNIDPQGLDAILITHEHADHVRGLEVFAKKYSLPVFANVDTAKALLDLGMKDLEYTIFTTGEAFSFKEVEIHPFSIQHDTMDPVAFTLQTNGCKIGICTDLGFATSLVKAHLKHCSALLIESNHEPSMVHASSRPDVYKTRVLGRQGHLSNDACNDLLKEVLHPGLQHVILAHLSEECNNPTFAYEKARKTLNTNVGLTTALQHQVSEAITVATIQPSATSTFG